MRPRNKLPPDRRAGITWQGLPMRDRHDPQHVVRLAQRAAEVAGDIRAVPTAEQVQRIRQAAADARRLAHGRRAEASWWPKWGPRDHRNGHPDNAIPLCRQDASEAWDLIASTLRWLSMSCESSQVLRMLGPGESHRLALLLEELEDHAQAVWEAAAEMGYLPDPGE